MADGDFEARLKADLPRGLTPQKSLGRERALSARWLGAEEITGKTWEYSGKGLLLGRRKGGLIGWDDNRHALTVAGSRAGKGVSLIVPNLILYEGSAFVVDPKGENAAITAGRRGKGTRKKGAGLGQDVYVLDPFDVSGTRSRRERPVSFNPLAELDIDGEDVVEDASMFAEALITHAEKDRHWTESAQALLRALILVALADRDPRRRNLITVRRLLTLTDRRIRDVQHHFKEEFDKDIDPQEALIELLHAQKKRRFGYVCTGIAAQLEAMGAPELGSVLSTTKTQTQWLDDPRMKNVLCRSDFGMADLKLKPTTIYLCLPAMRMGTHARWLRLMIFLALTVMERTPEKPKEPVLFVLDEFPVLGHMQPIETAAGLMAGYGVKLWTIVQNLGQLKQHYDKSWETFFANAGVVTGFGVIDQESQRALSAKLGKLRMTTQVPTGAAGSELLKGTPSQRDERFNVPLLSEDELGRIFDRETKRMLILGAGLSPAIAERLEYHSDPMFDRLWDERRPRRSRSRLLRRRMRMELA